MTQATLSDLRISLDIVYRLINFGLVNFQYENLFGTGRGLSHRDLQCGNFTFRYVAAPPGGQNFIFQDVPGAAEYAQSVLQSDPVTTPSKRRAKR